MVYMSPARLHRTRWLFDRIDEIVLTRPDGLVAIMVVLPSADTPDGPTRAENASRFKKVSRHFRRLITTPVGDAFRMSVVRTIMRALSLVSGQSGMHLVASTVPQAIQLALEVRSADTPNRVQIAIDIREIHRALGADTSHLEINRAPESSL